MDLIVGTEIQKLILTAIIAYDAEMVSPETGKSLITRAINLWEELGEVEYVFCDKTGTLTQNKLRFKRFAALKGQDADLWRCVNLCHECTVIGKDFHGPSLDEVCLLTHACADDSTSSFLEKNSKEMVIKDGENQETWEIVKLIPFSADTKSMTIIVKKDGKLIAFIKGADSSILPLCQAS